MNDSLGDRIKTYEQETRLLLPRHTYTVLRLDGKAFHTFTRHLEKPHSEDLSSALDQAAGQLCRHMMGARFAYGQSDEYSFLLTDFEQQNSEAWFGGNVQKITSVAASIFTAEFNQFFRYTRQGADLAYFDARVFSLPTSEEVVNYFIWRQQDAIKNSVSMLAYCHLSCRALMNKNTAERLALLQERGIDWHAYPPHVKYGRIVRKDQRERTVTWTHRRTGQVHEEVVMESYWCVDTGIPVFTQERTFLGRLIPERPSGLGEPA